MLLFYLWDLTYTSKYQIYICFEKFEYGDTIKTEVKFE